MPFDGTEINDPMLTILEKVKALLIRPRGWIKGSFKERVGQRKYPEEYGYCLMGAGYEFGVAFETNQTDYVKALGFSTRAEIENWNDRTSRRKKDVIALLDAAIEKRQIEALNTVK